MSSSTDYEELGYEALTIGGQARTSGMVVSRRLRDGTSIGYTHDNLGRVASEVLPGTEPDTSYTYDNLGRVTLMAKSGVNVSFTYDVLGRKLTESGTLGTVTSAYDIAGRRTRITHPGGAFYVDQDYLVTGEMSKIRENGATSGAGVLATFGYDDQGRRTSLTRGNGTVTSYGYDPVSRLASLSENLAGTTHDQTLGFTYTPASQIATNTRSNDLYAWGGHGSGTTNSTVNGLNQLTAQGGASITHDARGNTTGDGTRTYGYDSRNRLASVTLGSATSTLVYDAAGRLNKLDAPYSRWYAYDGVNRILEGN